VRALGLQMSRDMKAGRPGIHDDSLVRENQFRAGPADRLFLVELMSVAGGKSELVGFRVGQTRATMGSLESSLAFQDVQVPPNRRNRGIHELRKLIQRRKFHLGKVFLDALMSLFGL